MSLGRLKRDITSSDREARERNMEIMHNLRVWRSHGRAEKSRLLSKFQLESPETLTKSTVEAGSEVGQRLGLRNLALLAEEVLEL